uniref:Uncharacterized protein n=1 Tax=Anguilla anguilla TaxID=7936 RepID=A0A0E9UVB6_ANGAN
MIDSHDSAFLRTTAVGRLKAKSSCGKKWL